MSLRRSVSCQPRHAVQVGIVAGDVRQTKMLNHRDIQGVIAQQAVLNAHRCGVGGEINRNRHDLNSQLGDFLDGLTERRQLLNLVRLPFQVVDDLRFPAELPRGFISHQLMSCLTENVRGGDSSEFSPSDEVNKIGTRQPVDRVSREVVHQQVSVQKNAFAGR